MVFTAKNKLFFYKLFTEKLFGEPKNFLLWHRCEKNLYFKNADGYLTFSQYIELNVIKSKIASKLLLSFYNIWKLLLF